MAKRSAGVLLYKCESGMISVLLVHPGGPFWRHKDKGAWQIPKGLIAPDETPLAAALRETAEELGTVFSGEAISLGEVQQAGGKYVEAFAINELWNTADLVSNSFEIEWPPRRASARASPRLTRRAGSAWMKHAG